MRVTRLAGPPGAGKSSIAWALAEIAAASGEAVAHVDIDQLGICYPARPDDPERWVLKERALAAVADVHAEAGASTLVVSGVASPDAPPRPVPGHPTTSIWLDVPPAVRAARLSTRGWDDGRAASVTATGTAESLRLHDGWGRLDLGSSSLPEAVELVRGRAVDDTEHRPDVTTTAAAPTPGALPVLWLTGPRCAGASTVGWRIASDHWRDGTRCAFVDVAQLSFRWGHLGPVPIGVAALDALLAVFAEDGAAAAVVVTPIDADPTSLRAPRSGVIRLDAGPGAVRARAAARTAGGGPVLAGDDLAGRSADAVADVVDRARRERSRPLRVGERVVPTDGMTPAAVVDAVRVALAQG